MNDRPAPPPEDKPPRPVRLAAICGVVCSTLLVGQFFLPALSVPNGAADGFAARVSAAAEDQSVDADLARDFAAVFESVARTDSIMPADLLHYARTAGRQRRNLKPVSRDAPDRAPGDTPADRILFILLVCVAGPPLGALVVLAYLLFHRLRRFRSPVLILALVVGLIASLLPTAYQYARHGLAPHVLPGSGMWVTLAASAGLLLTAVFGVTTRNWWRVYLGAAIVLTSLGLIAWVWTGAASTG